jgi:hypothetical protein
MYKEETVTLGPGSAITAAGKREESACDEIRRMADVIADRASVLAGSVEGQLEPITRQPEPQVGTIADKPSREYPPLFDELKTRLDSIRYSLDRIEDTMNRVEL